MNTTNECGDAATSMAAVIADALGKVPFAEWLGLRLGSIEGDRVFIDFETRAELVGNSEKNVLHGGVIASVLDTVGGLAALLGFLTRSDSGADSSELSPWLSTIDMRTDFLRPGIGERFDACAFPLRVGNRLVVTRMELHGESGHLIAVGTGTYVLP